MQQRTSSTFRLKRKALILVGAGIGALLILVVLFFPGRIDLSPGDMRGIQDRFRHLERRIARLEDTKERIVFLQKQERAIKKRIAGSDRGEVSLEERLEDLSARVDRLEKTLAAGASRTGALSKTSREPLPLPGGRYHVVQSGDSLSKIAQHYGISVDELCRLNSMTPNQIIYPGQRLLVAPEGTQ